VATLVTTKIEEHPYNDQAVAAFAYFNGTPTQAELTAAQLRAPVESDPSMKDTPELCPDAVSQRASLERWFLGCVC
jgi:hypothetical protein